MKIGQILNGAVGFSTLRNAAKSAVTAFGLLVAPAFASSTLAAVSGTYNSDNNDDVIETLTTSVPELFFMGYEWNNPSFKGNLKELSRVINENLKYPEAAYKNNIEGCVMIEFSIAPDGEINDIKIDDTVNPILAQEVIRCVKLTAGLWGVSTDKSEHPTYKLSIDFEL